MATPAQEDVRAYIQERRKHRARRVGQVSGATAAVMSDKENAVDALRARDPYPEVVTAMEKAQQKGEVVDKMAELEQGYYKIALGSLDARYNVNVTAYSTQQRLNSMASQHSASLAAQGDIEASRALSALATTAGEMTQAGKDLTRRAGLHQQGQPSQNDGTSLLEGVGPGGTKFNLSGSSELIPGSEGQDPTVHAEDPAVKAAIQAAARELYEGQKTGMPLREINKRMNTITNLGAAYGIEVEPVLKGVVVDGRSVGVQTYLKSMDDSSAYQKDLYQNSDEGIEALKSLGSGGQTDVAEAMGIIGLIEKDIYGDYDKDKTLLPGIEIVPESEANARYEQILDVIEAQPEQPAVIEMREQIMKSEPFLAYTEKRGYGGMDPAKVMREYTRESKIALRQEDKDFRKKRKQNIDEGIAKTRFNEPEKKPEEATESADVAGGTQRG